MLNRQRSVLSKMRIPRIFIACLTVANIQFAKGYYEEEDAYIDDMYAPEYDEYQKEDFFDEENEQQRYTEKHDRNKNNHHNEYTQQSHLDQPVHQANSEQYQTNPVSDSQSRHNEHV